MSNRRKIKLRDLPELLNWPVLNLVAESGIPLRTPGGCDHCDAEQKVWREREGLWHTQIIHDDDCPWFVARQERLKGVGR